MIATAPGDDVDHPAHRVGAINGRSWSTDKFDPLNVIQVQGGEIIGPATGVGGVIGFHPVQQHQSEIGLGAAREQRHHTAAPARLLDMDAGQIAQQIHHTARIARLNGLSVDHRDIAAGLLAAQPCGGHDDIFGCGVGDARQTQQGRAA